MGSCYLEFLLGFISLLEIRPIANADSNYLCLCKPFSSRVVLLCHLSNDTEINNLDIFDWIADICDKKNKVSLWKRKKPLNQL